MVNLPSPKPHSDLYITTFLNHLKSGKWINLEDPPSPFAESQALLLCQISQFKWVSWVPGYGEYILNFSYFEPI